jgi:hypothetical protein
LPSDLFYNFHSYLQVLDKTIAEFDKQQNEIANQLLEALTSHQEAAE